MELNNTESNVAVKIKKPFQQRKWLIIFLPLMLIVFFKISIISIGNAGAGHTAIIWKGDGMESLRVFDSARAACERKGLHGFLCEGALAIAIQDRGIRLVGLPYSKFYSKIVGGN